MKTLSPREIVEVFHLCFLDAFGLKTDKQLYVLKGGCNLRFFFNSIRYSEDLDIDVQTIAKNTLANKVDTILASTSLTQRLKPYQITIADCSSPKQTQTTQRWKVQLTCQSQSQAINTKIEFSRRSKIVGAGLQGIKPQTLSHYQLGPILSNHYLIQQAFEQKITALINRSQTQVRDVFDLYWLLSQDTSLSQLSDLASIKRDKACENVCSMGFADFQSQVVSYLTIEHQSQYGDQSVWDEIQHQVLQAIEGSQQ